MARGLEFYLNLSGTTTMQLEQSVSVVVMSQGAIPVL